MLRIIALNLNNILGGLKVTGESITPELRKKTINTKIVLSKVLKDFNDRKELLSKEDSTEEEKQKLILEQLYEDVSIKLDNFTIEDIDNLISKTEDITVYNIELMYTELVK